MMSASIPERSFSVLASSPVRTADVGGWTDTWFAEYGLVCSVAIERRVEVRIDLDPQAEASVHVTTGIDGSTYTMDPSAPPGHHPMIESAISALPPSGEARIMIGDGVVPGAGLGGSAAVMVALVAALRAARGERQSRVHVARVAHGCELSSGRESGVQDHWASSFGGINRLAVNFPEVRRERIRVAPAVERDLTSRLHTVYFGRSHDSSALHSMVMATVMSDASMLALDRIRDAAHLAAVALKVGDLEAYGAALISNHAALTRLHRDLISDDAHLLEQIARKHRARGWKVNGAGGRGGSMVVLGPVDPDADRRLCEAIEAEALWQLLDAPVATHGVVAHLFEHEDPRSPGSAQWQTGGLR